MPNRQTHVTMGTLAGGALAAYRAREQKSLNILLEVIGGCIGGHIGGRLPDVIEPASWPGHRQLAHSVIAGGAVGFSVYELLGKWEKLCRSNAEIYSQQKTNESVSAFNNIFDTLIEILLRVVAGFLSGLGAGYLSHLTLDTSTPNGLPFLQ